MSDTVKKILCAGNACVDVTVRPVDGPLASGTLKIVDSIVPRVGGCAANAPMDLAKLGAKVDICCAVSGDGFGDFILSEFKKTGLSLDGVTRFNNGSTSASIVHVSTAGERSFLHDPGVTAIYTPMEIPEHLIDNCEILFLTGALIMERFDGVPAAALLKDAQRRGKTTVMDTCWDSDGVWLPKLKDALAFLDVFMPSIEEAAMLAGTSDPDAICDAFVQRGVKNVIIKHGSRGAYICETNGRRYWSPAYRRKTIIDTNGAGDAFCAGFLCALARGWEIEDCVQYANAVGSFCVTAAGPCSGIPSMEAVDLFLKDTGGSTVP